MEFITLDSKFRPARIIEGHSSLIWTERYSKAGDFSRESGDIGGTLSALPLEQPDGSPTVVSLRDSTVPMIVESHKIEKSLKGPAKITTTGRSFETVLDRRTTFGALPFGGSSSSPTGTVTEKSSSDAGYRLMYNVVQNASFNGYPENSIYEINIVQPDDYGSGSSSTSYAVDPGELYAWVLQHVQANNHGMRAIRPTAAADSKVTIKVYAGVDRSTSVVFDSRFDQFDNTTYLLSKVTKKNTAQVYTQNGAVDISDDGNTGTPTYTGIQRRVMYVDGSDVSLPGGTELDQAMANMGLVALAHNVETVLFSGEVANMAGKKYGTDFYVGDIVKLNGDYGLSQFVRVSEFIRSVDDQGEKAYPTFEALS